MYICQVLKFVICCRAYQILSRRGARCVAGVWPASASGAAAAAVISVSGQQHWSRCRFAEGAPHRDVPGTPLCRRDVTEACCVAHNGDAGHSTGTTLHSGCSGSEGGRRSRKQRGRSRSSVSLSDHAAWATLGRPRRPRRPGLREQDRDRPSGRETETDAGTGECDRVTIF